MLFCILASELCVNMGSCACKLREDARPEDAWDGHHMRPMIYWPRIKDAACLSLSHYGTD